MIYVFIGLMLLCDVIILVTLATVSPISTRRETSTNMYNLETDTDEIGQVLKCTCQHQNEFTIAIFSYKGLLLVFGVFFCIQLRKLRNNRGGGSWAVTSTFAVYNITAISVVGVISVVALSNTTNHEATYAAVGVSILIGVSGSLILLYRKSIKGLWVSN